MDKDNKEKLENKKDEAGKKGKNTKKTEKSSNNATYKTPEKKITKKTDGNSYTVMLKKGNVVNIPFSFLNKAGKQVTKYYKFEHGVETDIPKEVYDYITKKYKNIYLIKKV